jgi:hypothetical protein
VDETKEAGTLPRWLTSVPDWAWFGCAIAFVWVIVMLEEGNYPQNEKSRLLQVATVITCFFIYLYPGWRLARYAERRLSKRWGEYAALAILLAWAGLPIIVIKFGDAVGFWKQ